MQSGGGSCESKSLVMKVGLTIQGRVKILRIHIDSI